MANLKYDINTKYVPNLTQQGELLANKYSPKLNLSTSAEKIKPYIIDLGQSATGTPTVLYSADLGQSATGTPSVIYTVNTDQSGKGTPSVPYSVNTDQSSTGIFNVPYSVNTDQSATGRLRIPYSVNTEQSSTVIFSIPYSVNTNQSATITPNSYQRPADQSGVGIPSPSFNDFIVQGNVDTSQFSNDIGPSIIRENGEIEQNTFLSNNKYTSETIELNSSLDTESAEQAAAESFKGLESNFDQIDLTNRLISAGSTFLGSNSILDGLKKLNHYETLPFIELRPDPDLPGNPTFQDYRKRFTNKTFVHGAAAAARGSARASVYALASSLSPGGAYPIFNIESTYGFPDTKSEPDLDFTARSEVATTWNGLIGGSINLKNTFKKGQKVVNLNRGAWQQTINPLERFKEFTGDKVSVIDFGQRGKNNIYQWKPTGVVKNFIDNNISILGDGLDMLGVGQTSDLVKFYFTGPKMHPNSTEQDDVIVFRAIISSLTDSFSGNWSPIQFIGRADPSYTYQGFSRNFDLNFTVYASHRDELKPIYRKLNYLASYTAPEYSNDTLVMKAPYLRITVGDLLVHQPIAINSIFYTFQDADTTWEINIEKDPTNMEVPKKIDVNLSGFLITDYLPQKGGRFYTLAKSFDRNGQPRSGDRDWLSDSVATTNTEFDEGSINELIGKLKRDKSKTKSKKKTLFKRKDKNDVSVNNLIPGTDSTDDLLGPGGVGGENYI